MKRENKIKSIVNDLDSEVCLNTRRVKTDLRVAKA